MAAITNYPKVISLASTDIVTIHDASSRRTKRTDIVQICKYARDYIQLGEDLQKVDYLQELMTMLTIVDGNIIMTSTDSYLGDDALATTSAVRFLITETTNDLASAQDITQLRANLTAYVDGSIVSFTTADAVSQLIADAGVGYSTAADLTTLQTTMQGYTNGQLTSYSTTEATRGLIADSTTDVASSEAFTKLQSQLGTFDDEGNLQVLSSSIADQVLSTENTATFAKAESLTKLKSEFGTFDEEGKLITLSSSISEKVLSTENTAQFAAASEIDTLQAQFTDEDGNTLISRIDENKQVIAGVDGKTEAIYTLEVDNGTGNIAGMKLGSNAEGSEIRFTADSFKISNGTVGETPFEVVDGSVKIKAASIGSITLGDLQGPAGEPGEDGNDGDPGATKYTWVKYADSLEHPRGLSNWHADKKYIGMAFNKDTATESTNPLDYAWTKIKGEDGLPGEVANAGENGKKTASGTLFFQTGTQSAPSAPSSSSAVFLFVNGVFTGLPSGWGLSTPEMAAGTASNNYWTVSWSAIETAADSNEGAVTFGPVTRSFAFNQVVTFDSLETSGSTVINGDNITTGIIKDTAYLNTSGDGFSDFGMAVDLNNGSIHAENFYINPNGDASFAGSHGSGTLGGWEINEDRIFKESTTGGISLSSARNALEIFDEDNSLTVDINNKGTLSSLIGTTAISTSILTSAGDYDFEITQPVANSTGAITMSPPYERGTRIYSLGQLDFNIEGNVGETVRVNIPLGRRNLIGLGIDYPAHWDVQMMARVGFVVYDSDTGVVIYSRHFNYTGTASSGYYGNDSASLTTSGNETLQGTFYKHASNNYHVKVFTQDHYAEWDGELVNSEVTINGTFSNSFSLGEQGQATMVLDANKTEILAGGFQVIKSATEYLRLDRNSQSFIESSGPWRHVGEINQDSDRNQKYNIKPIDFDLDLLSNLNGYSYSQILNPVNTLSKARAEDIHTIESTGLIAQEIEEVLPNAVSTNENGIKTLNYSAVTGLLMNIVKQLNEKITFLELEINNLKN